MLTSREYRILCEVVETGSGVLAAERLGLALSTLKNHLTAIRAKTATTSTIQLAYRLGCGDLDHLLPNTSTEEKA